MMRFRVISSRDIYREGRFDGSYHNAEAIVYDNIIKSHSSHNLNYYCTDIFTSGRNKRAYTSKEFGYPFLSNSDAASQNPFSSCKYSSRKYGYDESAVLKAGMILTGRVGAIGQTSFVPKYWEEFKAMGSDNIIRIVVKPEYRNGYIYAYLASKIGNLQFWKYATGGVQPFITDAMVGFLPIPDFSESFQKKVDDLIKESARLREEATEALEEAKSIIFDFCCLPYSKNDRKKINSISLKNIINSFNTRLDPPIYINGGVKWAKNLKVTTKRLGDCNVNLWYPGMFKRVYVNNGLPYIKGSSLFVNNPFRSCEKLSRSKTPDIDELWLKEGMILISCAGACGQVKLITKEYSDKSAIGSPDIIRLVSSDELFTKEYLFAYLQIPPIYDYMQSLKYGSVIERFDTYNIENIPIVEPTKQLSERVTSIIRHYMDCTYCAFNCEEKAIAMVESEIEKWNN